MVTGNQQATINLLDYILSDKVTEQCREFIPKQAVISLLETTSSTIKHRVESGELTEKTFFLPEPTSKAFMGIEIGGIKRLLLKKQQQRSAIFSHLELHLGQHTLTSYADAMSAAGMNWKSPPDRKYCNTVLHDIGKESYLQSIGNGRPCLKSAIVVSRNEHIPTEGFFNLAISLGLLDAGAGIDEKLYFWESQRDLAFELYGNK